MNGYTIERNKKAEAFHALVESVATFFPAGYKIGPAETNPDGELTRRRKFTGPNGEKCSIRANSYPPAMESKVTTSGDTWIDGEFVDVRPYTGGSRGSYPEINTAISRGPEKIAKDIAKRFMPKWAPIWAEIVAKVNTGRAYMDRIRTATENMAEHMDNARLGSTNRKHNPSKTDTTNLAFTERAEVAVSEDYTSEEDPKALEYRVKLDGLTEAEAVRVLKALRG